MPNQTGSYPSYRASRGRTNNSRYSSGGASRSYGGGNNRRRSGSNKTYIDPAKFVKEAMIKEIVEYVPSHAFADFEIDELIKNNLKYKGYISPSAIQDQTISLALEGKDIVGIADTGSGKTAAFAVPVLNAAIKDGTRALIVAPTRELAQQIEVEIRSIARNSRIRTAVIIGGTGMGGQLHALKSRPEIVIGTPGRIKDHMDRRTLNLNNFKFVVLDEVDRMLDMGFVNDMREILAQLSPEKQSLYFSATLNPNVKGLIETFSKNPVTISVKTGDTGENIHQNVVKVGRDSEKLDKLHDLLISDDINKVIIFDDTQRGVERLNTELLARGFKVDAIHGGKSQGQRQRSLAKFKTNQVTILVATDVAARGIDVPDVTHVINYSTPNSYEDYVHRIGRAGRAGKVGYALTFVTS